MFKMPPVPKVPKMDRRSSNLAIYTICISAIIYMTETIFRINNSKEILDDEPDTINDTEESEEIEDTSDYEES